MASQSHWKIIVTNFFVVLIAAKWSIHQIAEITTQQSEVIIQLRSQQSVKRYQQFREKLKEMGISVPEYIQNQKFGYDGQAASALYFIFNFTYESQTYPVYLLSNSKDHEWISAVIDEQSQIGGLTRQNGFLMVTINDFPYDVQDGIEHWLVWSNREVELELVNQLLKDIKSDKFEFYAFVNPPNRKSIPEIFHAQVFLQRTATTDTDL